MTELLDIRWVCAVCLKVIREPLRITRRIIGGTASRLLVMTARGPRCCGFDMLVAGEPKVDRWGLSGQRGALIDPVDNLRMKIVA